MLGWGTFLHCCLSALSEAGGLLLLQSIDCVCCGLRRPPYRSLGSRLHCGRITGAGGYVAVQSGPLIRPKRVTEIFENKGIRMEVRACYITRNFMVNAVA
jgi:hypothetical protein